jgi:hypothetical protein
MFLATMAFWPPDMEESWKRAANHIQPTAGLLGRRADSFAPYRVDVVPRTRPAPVDTCAVKSEKFFPPRESLASREEGLLH